MQEDVTGLINHMSCLNFFIIWLPFSFSFQILFSLASIVLIQGYPTDQYYYNHNNHRNIVPERQILYELPTQTYYYQPRDGLSRPVNGISRPVYYPQLGMSPQYHNLVYNYITDYAGNQKPAQFPVSKWKMGKKVINGWND